jgi:hypothetical protein
MRVVMYPRQQPGAVVPAVQSAGGIRLGVPGNAEKVRVRGASYASRGGLA